MPVWVWAGLGVVLLLLETMHGAFILSILGGAAIVTAAIAVLVPGLPVTIAAFAILSLLGLQLLRPALLRRLGDRNAVASNVAGLIGQRAHVRLPFDADGIGRVRVGGEEWRAHLRSGGPLQPDAPLWVVGSSGATLEVAPDAPEPPVG